MCVPPTMYFFPSLAGSPPARPTLPRALRLRASIPARAWVVPRFPGLLLRQVPQDLPGDLAVVEADRPVAEDLVGLVALPGDQDHVVLLGALERQLDRAAPVGLDRIVRPALHAP